MNKMSVVNQELYTRSNLPNLSDCVSNFNNSVLGLIVSDLTAIQAPSSCLSVSLSVYIL